MGKGDQKTRKGKLIRGTNGVRRPPKGVKSSALKNPAEQQVEKK